MCLPLLIFPCTIKSRSSLLAPAHPGGPGKRAVTRLCGGGGSDGQLSHSNMIPARDGQMYRIAVPVSHFACPLLTHSKNTWQSV